jgi:hypothetical protein
VRTLIDSGDIVRGQVDTSELGRQVSVHRVAIAAEGSLERLARKIRSRAQEVFRFGLMADLAVERRVVRDGLDP